MTEQIEFLRITRRNYLAQIEGLSLEQLNTIPAGFKNNIIWNVAHAVITQQLLHYALGGEAPVIDQEILDKFRKGASPGDQVSAEEVDQIKEWMLATPDQLEKDYKAGLFKKYKEYTTSYGSTLRNIEEAITFNNIHEGLHLGTVMALKKLV